MRFMEIELLKKLLVVPTTYHKEDLMVRFILDKILDIPHTRVSVDEYKNIYVTKGGGESYACVAAHTDTVFHWTAQPRVVVENNLVYGEFKDHQIGLGADDKVGIFLCLTLLKKLDNLKAVFFATEEIGCIGARNSCPEFFADVGYVLEFDCPGRGLLSYTSWGIRPFYNSGDFMKTALPVLAQYGTTLWQHHPYTDISMVRKLHRVNCLNLSCGYYFEHRDQECIWLPDVNWALAQGEALLQELGPWKYACPDTCYPTVEDDLQAPYPVTEYIAPVLPIFKARTA
jgi:hypothetical protein